ncbi:hypothetical protein BSPWISOXPB_9744 [uncultured Gammaproteobacteria bacterium]|nr:hypothetical protein BSPWISOXPB_9744 [uncultured Gammaproteobacteria bacterium]
MSLTNEEQQKQDSLAKVKLGGRHCFFLHK